MSQRPTCCQGNNRLIDHLVADIYLEAKKYRRV